MLILFYGTSIYNAPNAGSILLDGHWYSFGIDCSQEYEAARQEKREADAKSNGLTHKNTYASSSTEDYYSDSDNLLSSLLEYDQSIIAGKTQMKISDSEC